MKNRGSEVSLVISVQIVVFCVVTSCTVGWLPAGGYKFSVFNCTQTGSCAKPSSYSMIISFLSQVKAAEAWNYPLIALYCKGAMTPFFYMLLYSTLHTGVFNFHRSTSLSYIPVYHHCTVYPFKLYFSRWTLGFRESKCFLRGHDILMAMNNYKISGNSVIKLIIV